MVESLPSKQAVAGSNPVSRSTFSCVFGLFGLFPHKLPHSRFLAVKLYSPLGSSTGERRVFARAKISGGLHTGGEPLKTPESSNGL